MTKKLTHQLNEAALRDYATKLAEGLGAEHNASNSIYQIPLIKAAKYLCKRSKLAEPASLFDALVRRYPKEGELQATMTIAYLLSNKASKLGTIDVWAIENDI